MGELHNFLQNKLGCPVLVLMGNDKIGIMAIDPKHNYYIVNTKKEIVKTTEDNAFECFSNR